MVGVGHVRCLSERGVSLGQSSSPWALLDVEGREEEEGEERRCDWEWEEEEEQDWCPSRAAEVKGWSGGVGRACYTMSRTLTAPEAVHHARGPQKMCRAQRKIRQPARGDCANVDVGRTETVVDGALGRLFLSPTFTAQLDCSDGKGRIARYSSSHHTR